MKLKGIKNKNVLEEIDQAQYELENPYCWESYCGACDNFETEQCPFKNKVCDITEWKQIKCNNFYD